MIRKFFRSVPGRSVIITAMALGIVAGGSQLALADFTHDILCTQAGLCMASSGIGTEPVYGRHLTQNNQQYMSLTGASACGGHVTSNCPFNLGLGLNNQFLGDEIVTLNRYCSADFTCNNNGTYYLGGSGAQFAEIVQGQLTEAGHQWVLDGQTSNGSYGRLINVYDSDTAGHAEYAEDGGCDGCLLHLASSIVTGHSGWTRSG